MKKSEKRNQNRSFVFEFSFGVEPSLEPVYHEGIMRTKCDDCQFVLVKQNDYFEILNKVSEIYLT